MIKKLYKYRAFAVSTLRHITAAEVFYCPPGKFNDPMDCDPTIEVDVDRATLEKLYYRLLLRRIEKKDAAGEVNYLRYLSTEHGDFQTDKEVEDYLVRMIASGIKNELDREFANSGILSLSATWASALMWSHYADEHRGICIEYDITDQAHPRLAPVSYRAPRAIKTSDLIRWKVRDDADSKRRVLQTYFYAKSSEWKYEKEWRDVRDDSGVHDLPFRLTAIHFGLRCDSAVVATIVKLLNEEQQIKLYGIQPKEESFKLRRALIDRDEVEAYAVREPGFLMFKDIVWGDEEIAEDLPEAEGVPAAPMVDS